MKIEIKNSVIETIDWSEPQLVESIKGLGVVSTTGITSVDTFQGFSHTDQKFYANWKKAEFKPFHGTITLSND